MKRIAICASLIVFGFPAFAQAQAPPMAETPFADKVIREVIASLKKKQGSFEKADEKAKLAKAIAALELALKPPAEPMKEKEKAKEAPKVVADWTKLTHENYLKIKIGMNRNEVEAILGKAQTTSSQNNITVLAWRNTMMEISLKFRPVGDDTPFTDKTIRAAIASLKKTRASFKKPDEKAKLAKAIAALELSVKLELEVVKWSRP
jgi:hypothetical protein